MTSAKPKQNGNTNASSSSSGWWKKVLLLIISVAIIISCVDKLKNHAPSIVTKEQQQHRRLAAEDYDILTAQQTSTRSVTSKFNEKRSFLDPSWKEWGDALVQFETLVSPTELDFTIPRRLPWAQDDSPDKCKEILVLMPEYFARNGHGSQLNSYVLAAMMATYLGKAMLIFDAPQKNSKYPNGSMVSCLISFSRLLWIVKLFCSFVYINSMMLSYTFHHTHTHTHIHSLVVQSMHSKIGKSLNNSQEIITNIWR